MKCKNKIIKTDGLRQTVIPNSLQKTNLQLIITNDDTGKTMTVTDGTVGFTFPADAIVKYLQ